MSAPGLVRRLWHGVRHRHGLGRIVIKFYPHGREASITVSPEIAAMSRRYWHWLYLQDLVECLAAIPEAQERVRLLAAARAMAEDFVSRSYWPNVIGEVILEAGAGAADLVPERDGGVVVEVQVIRRGDGMPAVRLACSSPQARERVASSNLVLLVCVMKAAAHPLEQYELCKKIALYAEYCERSGCPRDRATLQGAALYAVVHADVTDMGSPGAPLRPKAVVDSPEPTGRPAPGSSALVLAVVWRSLSALRSLRDRLLSPEPFWKRPRVAMGTAAVLWAGLALAAFLLPHFRAPLSGLRDIAGAPSSTRHHTVAARGPLEVRREARIPAATAEVPRASRSTAKPGAVAIARRPATVVGGEQRDIPRFRVVSGTLALNVAEHRSKVLAEQGVDAFVAERAGKLGRLQYGAYHFRAAAEEDARHFRAQGYTAVVIPW